MAVLNYPSGVPITTGVEFLFREGDVFYAQQADAMDRAPKNIGELETSAIQPDLLGLRDLGWSMGVGDASKSYLGQLIASKTWSVVVSGHREQGEETFAKFKFIKISQGARPNKSPLLERATLDMVGWLGSAGLISCVPDEVKIVTKYTLRDSGIKVCTIEDVRQQARPIFQEFAQIAGLE